MTSEKYLAKIYRFILDCENETASGLILADRPEAETLNQPVDQEGRCLEYNPISTT